MSESQPEGARPPGWYADPRGGPLLRWWDGGGWTNQVTDQSGPPRTDGYFGAGNAKTGRSVVAIVLIVLALVVGLAVLLFGLCVALLSGGSL